MIRLAFRLDDPSRTSDHDLERQILDCFRQADIPLTCAVVPYTCSGAEARPLTADAVPHLVQARSAGIIEVALHGYCHRELARLTDGNRTEFAGVDRRQQREALAAGKARIEDVFPGPLTGFVPPWNSYDQATLDLLGELGFGYVSADWALVSEHIPPIPVIPHTCNLVHLQEAVDDARQFAGLNPVIAVILHHFDLAESGTRSAGVDLSGLERLLAWVTDQPDLLCMSLADLSSGLDPQRCAANLRLARWRTGLHWRLQRLLPRYSLLDADRARLAAALGGRALLRLPRVLTA
jgi:peptidoglycan/xylan/chitin deacetylase (PgdA/CDA1 family)